MFILVVGKLAPRKQAAKFFMCLYQSHAFPLIVVIDLSAEHFPFLNGQDTFCFKHTKVSVVNVFDYFPFGHPECTIEPPGMDFAFPVIGTEHLFQLLGFESDIGFCIGLLYMGYRLRPGRDRLGKKSAGNGFEKIVPETRSGGPVPEVAGCQSEKDGDLPEREAVIERILSGGIFLPEDFSGFQEEHFFNRFESMDMETKSLLKEMEEKSVYAETFLERKMTGTGRQTYIHGSLYGELVRILPVIAPGLSVPAFVNNVLADHLKQHQDVINGMYREEVEKRLQEWKR